MERRGFDDELALAVASFCQPLVGILMEWCEIFLVLSFCCRLVHLNDEVKGVFQILLPVVFSLMICFLFLLTLSHFKVLLTITFLGALYKPIFSLSVFNT
jgi:hypothetical protein